MVFQSSLKSNIYKTIIETTHKYYLLFFINHLVVFHQKDIANYSQIGKEMHKMGAGREVP